MFKWIMIMLAIIPTLASAEDYLVTVTLTSDQAIALRASLGVNDQGIVVKFQSLLDNYVNDNIKASVGKELSMINIEYQKLDRTGQQKILDAVNIEKAK